MSDSVNQQPELKPTQHQQLAIEQILDLIVKQKKRKVLLTGGAGVGKSYCTNLIVKELQRTVSESGVLTAPTHKAVGVVDLMAKKYKLYGVDRMTTYRFMGIKMTEAEDIKRIKKIERDKCLMPVYRWGCLDECGMVDREFYNYIISTMERPLCSRFQKICTGDQFQLSPIGEKQSLTFSISDKVELTEVVRQAEDSPIIDAVLYARSLVEQEAKVNFDRFEECHSGNREKPGIWKLNRDEWFDEIVRVMSTPEFKKNPESAKAICFTNDVADWLNIQIRDRLYDGKEFFQVGEPLIAKESVCDSFDENVIKLNNSEDCIVTSSRYQPFEEYQFPRFNAWRLTIRSLATGNTHRVTCIAPDEQKAFYEALNNLGDAAHEAKMKGDKSLGRLLWDQFWKIQRSVANLTFPYCLTVRRSQGGSYKTIFPYMDNLCMGKNYDDIARRVYVAMSRAEEQLFLRV